MTWTAYIEWGYGSKHFRVKAWTKRGAISAAKAVALSIKPKAEVRFVSVAR